MTTLNTWKVVEPHGYYRSFIEKDIRPDGRKWREARPLTLKVGSITTAEGSATIRIGNTSVVCGIKAEISTPTLQDPDKGFIVPNVELYPCCSPQFRAGPPGEKAIATSQFLKSVIDSSNLIDLTSLCVVPNKVAWCLYCDIICLDYDGNITDIALLSLVAALRDVMLPKLTWDEDSDRIQISNEFTEKLDIKSKPVATTFTIYNDEIQLLDPSAEDEMEGNGEVTFVLKEDGSLCSTEKQGGKLLNPKTMESFLDVAKKRVIKINTAIDLALEKKDKKVKQKTASA